MDDQSRVRTVADIRICLDLMYYVISYIFGVPCCETYAYCTITPSFPWNIWIKSNKQWIIDEFGIGLFKQITDYFKGQVSCTFSHCRIRVIKSEVKNSFIFKQAIIELLIRPYFH